MCVALALNFAQRTPCPLLATGVDALGAAHPTVLLILPVKSDELPDVLLIEPS